MYLKQRWFFQVARSRAGQYIAKIGTLALLYYLAGQLAISIPGVNSLASSIWPAAGIAQAALLLWGLDLWPGIALGTFFLNGFGLQQPLTIALTGTLGASLQAVVAVSLLRAFQFRPAFDRLMDVLKLIFIGALLATQISCSLGVLGLYLSGKIELSQYWQVRWSWWLGDAIGVLIITPFLLIFSKKLSIFQLAKRSRKKFLKIQLLFGIWFLSLIAVSWTVFASKTDAIVSRYPLEYLPFPLIIWGAIQFGQRGSVLAAFTISCIAIWGGSQGGGPFVAKADTQSQAILFLQAFMGVVTVTSLLLAATSAERASAEKLLRQSELKYRELVENANSIIVKTDSQGRILFLNEFAQKFFGYSLHEILGKPVVGTIIPRVDTVGKDLGAMYQDLLQYPDRFTFNENENMRRSGERVWVAWTNKPLFDAEGELTEMLSIGTDITERRRTELALQKLNEELEQRVAERTAELTHASSELRMLFSAMTDLVIVYNRQGRCLKIVSNNPELLIKPLAEQVGKTVTEIVPEGQANLFLEKIQLVLEQRQTVNVEYSLEIGERERWFSANVSPLSEETVIWVSRDVSDRKLLEQKLHTSYTEMKAILEAMTDIIIVLDATASEIKVVPTNAGQFYPPDVDIISATVTEFLAGEQSEIFLSKIQQALTEKHSISFEYELLIAESKYSFFASIAPVSQEAAIWVARDITDLKRTEAELQAANAEMRALFSAMDELIFVFDGDGRHLKIASNNQRLQFRPSEERIGKTLHDIFAKEIADQFLGYITEALTTQRTVNVEYSLIIEGEELWSDASISPIDSNSVIWAVRDTTGRKKAEEALRLEKEKSEQLLLNILPMPVAERLKQGVSTIADTFAEVTVLFGDIVGFTQLSSRISPPQLVSLLNEIFSIFDHLAEKHGLEKIKTIGDAYMVVGGLPMPRQDHAEAIANMALDMQQAIRQFSIRSEEVFSIRIGINSGPVVAGVIGIKKFIYDLWGDTVNTASRMESHGIPGTIQVTESTYKRLQGQYVFEERGKIHVKGKGDMNTYFLIDKKSSLL